jgi:phosphatidylinositol alpha-mannosyltransferase
VSIKVLLVTPYSFQKYGGVQNQVNLIEDYLSSHEEFEVKVFAYGKTESLDSNKVFNIPFNSSVSSVLLFPNRKLLLDYIDWADVVHVHEPFVPIFFWKLPKNKKYIFTHHASLGRIITNILSIVYKSFRYRSISTYVSKSAESNALSLNSEPVLIPNMIKINPNISFNKRQGYLFIGRQESRKNYSFFVKLSNHKQFTNKLFYAITNKDKSDKNITIYENPTDEFKIEIFGKTNIYLALNTKSESFGITLLEAVNNGNLVISSDLISFINVLPNSHIVYKNNNFDSLCNVLTKLDSEDLNLLWNKQYKDIREYDLEENMKKFILLYSNL